MNQPRRMQQRGRINNKHLFENVRLQEPKFNHQNVNLQAQRNQQYLAQARALILARQEVNQPQFRNRGRLIPRW